MTQKVLIDLKCFCVFLLMTRVSANTNLTDTVKASVLVSDRINQTEPTPKINNGANRENKTIEMQRITQPLVESHSSSQQIGRTLLPAAANTSSSSQKGGWDTKLTEFRPSPQLDTYYEYNKFPVVPAFPEAKHFSGINLNEKPIRSETYPWLERPITSLPSTTQQPWYNKINFPTTQNPFLTVRDQPYPYLFTNSFPETTTKSLYPYVITGTNSETTTRSQYPFVITGTNSETTTKNPGFGSLPSFSKFGGFPIENSAGHGSSAGNFGNKFGGFDKGSLFGGFDKGSLFGGKGGWGSAGSSSSSTGGGGDSSLLHKTHFEQPQPHSLTSSGSSSVSPWKKIIKFLTAIIPIGLLISALTPTVINVASTNMTQARGRAEENSNNAAEKLLSSLNYINKLSSEGCEQRVVCELLMGAGSSSHAEQHIENLLEAFAEQERDVIDRTEELRKILEAVKSGECRSLICDGIPETSGGATDRHEEIKK